VFFIKKNINRNVSLCFVFVLIFLGLLTPE